MPTTIARLICLVLYGVTGAAAGGWHIVHPQSSDSAGTASYPSIRYGHTCAVYEGRMIATHGYYYDRESSDATWLSDTWALDISSKSHTWERLSHHLPQTEAHRHYSVGRIPRAPCGRFGHVSVVIGDALLLYGGHDGGYSRTNLQDYKPNNDFEEFWRFDLNTHTWSQLPTAGGPGKRYLSGATAVHNKLVLYGGMGQGRGDVWSYSPASGRWEQLAEEVPPEQGGPGRRIGHSLFAWVAGDADGFVLYGGQSTSANGSNVAHEDAWFFDLASRSWRKLQPVSRQRSSEATTTTSTTSTTATTTTDSTTTTTTVTKTTTIEEITMPPGRIYQAAMATTVPLPGSTSDRSCTAGKVCSSKRARIGIVAGGTLTTPGLLCASDAWAFSLNCNATRIAWARLPDFPAPLYDTRGVASAGYAWLFGGHLCRLDRPPPQPPFPYYYVNEVLRLDLEAQPGLAEVLRGGGGEGGGGVCTLRPGQEDELPAVELELGQDSDEL